MTGTTLPRFYMIRHGETEWNRERRYQGKADIPLNDTGRAQAAGNGRYLASLPIDWKDWSFVASPLSRAVETTRIIRTELGLDPDEFRTDERLMEVSFGEWERKLHSELLQEYPEAMAARDRSKWDHVPPGGESYAQAVNRVRDFFDGLDTQTVIVCHGGIIRATRYLVEGPGDGTLADGHVPQDRVYRYDGQDGVWVGLD